MSVWDGQLHEVRLPYRFNTHFYASTNILHPSTDAYASTDDIYYTFAYTSTHASTDDISYYGFAYPSTHIRVRRSLIC